jgi:hypothetical protein
VTERPDPKETTAAASTKTRDSSLNDPYALAWMDANVADLRRSVSDDRFLRSSLAVGFVLGVAAHIAGYFLKSSVKAEPLGLVADLLYALGFALWTGVVVVIFVQVLPETKRRQIAQVLDAYDAMRRNKR